MYRVTIRDGERQLYCQDYFKAGNRLYLCFCLHNLSPEQNKSDHKDYMYLVDVISLGIQPLPRTILAVQIIKSSPPANFF